MKPAEVKQLVTLIEAEARQLHTPVHDVFLRSAFQNGRVYVDLCDGAGSVVEIGPGNWACVVNPSIRFIRSPTMAPLPLPERGGALDELASLLNLRDQHLVLTIGWLLDAIRGAGIGHPLLVLRGPEGAAKSTALKILRDLIDPSLAPPGGLPKTGRNLLAAREQSYLLACDNVSVISAPMSDALCRFITGSGSRPIILNAIADVVARADLLDRSIIADCEAIGDEQRRLEVEFWGTFRQQRGRILGVLYTAVAQGLKEASQPSLQQLPRMADFAHWVVSCETALWPSGRFMAAYRSHIADEADHLLGVDPLVSALRVFINKRGKWTGTASELDAMLRAFSGGESVKGWPADPARLGRALRVHQAALSKIGISVTFSQAGHSRARHIIVASIDELDKKPAQPVADVSTGSASASSASVPSTPLSSTHTSPMPSMQGGSAGSADGADSADGTKDQERAVGRKAKPGYPDLIPRNMPERRQTN